MTASLEECIDMRETGSLSLETSVARAKSNEPAVTSRTTIAAASIDDLHASSFPILVQQELEMATS